MVNISKSTEDRPNLIAVGASAGGLEALQKFLSHLPDLGKTSIVVAQHLSPTHKSRLVHLLGRHTKMEVREAENEEEVKARFVYITPPNRNILIEDGKIRLSEVVSKAAPKPSIDILFKSLSRERNNFIVGIILSGTGTDGAEGIEELGNSGGYLIVQEPETAKYDGMPLAAVNTGVCDVVLPPEKMGEEIERFFQQSPPVRKSHSKILGETALEKIFNHLGNKTGSDFSEYKSATIGRRLEKRIQALKLNSIEEYLEVIEKEPTEAEIMFNTILIGVTSFFRDIEAFESLKDVIRQSLKKKKEGDLIRVWTPGCSTGEEAYSIAIILHQILEEDIAKYNVQIFATDIDDKAVVFARKGHYPETALENVPDQIKEKFFSRSNGGFEVKKSLRSIILFSKHNLLQNPPFLKLDFISCRNLLIYFNKNLQLEIIPTFHYALQQDGILFLGKSETIGKFTDLFGAIDANNKIYQRKRGGNIHKVKFSALSTNKKQLIRDAKKEKTPDLSVSEMIKETLISTFEHPYVVINEVFDILEVSGDVRLFISLTPGSIQVNLLKMLNRELQIEVRAVLTKAVKERVTIKSGIKKFQLYDTVHFVRITAAPVLQSRGRGENFIVIFEKLDIEDYVLKGTSHSEDSVVDQRVQELELELAATKEQLQTYIEEIETSNEELQSLNEELQSTNEELQSINEELETSNEELQSTNEEVQITSSELRLANEELERKEYFLKEIIARNNALLSNDLQAFLLLDKSYKVMSYNQKAVEIFLLLKSKKINSGDTIIDFIPLKEVEGFLIDFNSAIEGSTYTGEKQMIDAKGKLRWFKVCYTPVIIDDVLTKGISMSLLEITETKEVMAELRSSELLINSVFNATSTGICVTDEKGFIVKINEEYCKIYGCTAEEIKGQHFTQVVAQEDHLKFSKLYEAFFNGSEEASTETEVITKKGEKITVAISAELLVRPDGKKYKVTSVRNISQQKKEEARLRLLESVVVNTSDAVLITEAEPQDEPGPRIVYVNEAFTKMTGYSAKEVIGKSPRILQGPKTSKIELKKLGESLRKWQPREVTVLNYKKDGEEFWINFTVTPVVNDTGLYTHWIAIERDVTKQQIIELQKNLLSEITQMFNESEDLKNTLEAVLKLITDFGNFALAEIWLITTDKKQINLISNYSKSSKIETFYELNKTATCFKRGIGLPGVVWENEKRELWRNVGRKKKFVRNEGALKAGLRTVYGLPLFYNNEIVGVMIIGMDNDQFSTNSFELSLNSFETFLGAEIKRKQLKEELDKIFNFSPDIICIAGFDGYFRRINPAGCTLLGYTEEELLTIPVTELIHPDDREAYLTDLENHAFSSENRFISKSGKIIWLAWTSTSYIEDNLIYGVAKDITTKKETEKSLEKMNIILEQRAKELSISNQELEQFAYVASHDLQEPLRTISSVLTQLERKYEDALDEKAHRYINFAVDGAKRMRQIILDLLEFSRVGKNMEQVEEVDLKEIIEGILSLQRKMLEEKEAEVVINKMPVILSYKYPITQIFQNLIGNALKYSSPRRSPRIELSCEAHENHYQFSVKDNGIGIEKEYFDKIFIIFQRLHTKEEFSGNGMGLTIVKKIVEGLGGRIWVDSEVGEGSTFYFSLLKKIG